MITKKNMNASMWEIIPLFALRKMFPSLKWTNEYMLHDITANTNVNVSSRRYDIYSEVINTAVEISRIGAHSSKENLERDLIKQQFSNEAKVNLIHIREEGCDNANFTNVFTFKVGNNTNDIFFPISTLCPVIEDVAVYIERNFNINRKTNINYGIYIDEIKDLYKKVTGKVFDESDIVNISDEKLSEKLNIPYNDFVDFKDDRNISSQKAFLLLQNNNKKYVKNGNFIAKNAQEAITAADIISEKDKIIEKKDAQIQYLYELLAEKTKESNKKSYKGTNTDFELLKKRSKIILAAQRRAAGQFNIKRDREC